MKKISLMLILAAVVFSQPAAAQIRDETVLTYKVLTEEWDNLIGGVLDLTEDEAEVFWPLYRKYSDELGAIWDQRISVIQRYLKGRTTMSPEEARALLAESLEINMREVELEMKWAEIFDAVLPPKKVVRLFQAHNKLETLLSMEIVKDIPLVN